MEITAENLAGYIDHTLLLPEAVSSDIKKLCSKSTVLDGHSFLGRDVKSAQGEVTDWLRKIKVIP